jgi:hypothetical protein
MADNDKQESRASIPQQLYWLTLYFVAVGALYLWGYWGAFGINILQYIAPTDIVKVAAYPLASALVFFIMGMVVAEFSSDWIAPRLPPGGGADTRVGRALRKHGMKILSAIGVAAGLYLAIVGPRALILISVIVALLTYVPLKQTGLFSSAIPNDALRSAAIFLGVMLPPFALGHGARQAYDVLTNDHVQTVATAQFAGNKAVQSVGTDKLKYLGQTSGYVFLLTPDNSTVVVLSFDKIDGLSMSYNGSRP